MTKFRQARGFFKSNGTHAATVRRKFADQMSDMHIIKFKPPSRLPDGQVGEVQVQTAFPPAGRAGRRGDRSIIKQF
ncbi:MAG: hypothetical protein UV02_C0048G0008 [Candidatus Kuenenbacteria bacterium GW2011_GWA2_42_15]|uniref:Uncharacterized protein n=1 Tax=Candidatus Kuenenbacteria bacterium GW2011_GWA2_42_15 TaxID=1618677 RepID=A0A0G1B143_9BACT|nr:MAG: hypothetical protein UV02_C0048G0008 [Candidatus Kuenenbacteria bacterium GW2011_GWA2_42_15]